MSSVPPATPPRLQGEGFAISVYHKEENAFAYVTGVKDPGEEWRLPNTKEPHRASGRICSPKQVFSEKTALYMGVGQLVYAATKAGFDDFLVKIPEHRVLNVVAEIAKHKEMPQYFNPENTDCEVVLGLLSLFVHAKVNFTFVYASKAAFKRYECFDKRLQLHSYEGCEAPSMKELLTLLHDANETYSTSASQAGTLCTLLPLDASSSATLPSDASLLSPPPTAVVGPVFIEPVFEPTGPHAQLVSSMIRSCYLYVHDFSRIHCSYTVKFLHHTLERRIRNELEASYHFPAFEPDDGTPPLKRRKVSPASLPSGKRALTAETLDDAFKMLMTDTDIQSLHGYQTRGNDSVPVAGAIFIMTLDDIDARVSGAYHCFGPLVGALQTQKKDVKLVAFGQKCSEQFYGCDEVDVQQTVVAIKAADYTDKLRLLLKHVEVLEFKQREWEDISRF